MPEIEPIIEFRNFSSLVFDYDYFTNCNYVANQKWLLIKLYLIENKTISVIKQFKSFWIQISKSPVIAKLKYLIRELLSSQAKALWRYCPNMLVGLQELIGIFNPNTTQLLRCCSEVVSYNHLMFLEFSCRLPTCNVAVKVIGTYLDERIGYWMWTFRWTKNNQIIFHFEINISIFYEAMCSYHALKSFYYFMFNLFRAESRSNCSFSIQTVPANMVMTVNIIHFQSN